MARYDFARRSRRPDFRSQQRNRGSTWSARFTSAGWPRPSPLCRPEAALPNYLRAPGRQTDQLTEDTLEVRRLTYADLPQVIAIERRAFPTPWSLAMFVLELSKPSGICLAAVVDGRLAGYLDLLALRHRLARHERRRRRPPAAPGHRHGPAGASCSNGPTQPGEQYTLEVRASNADAMRLYERFGFRSAGLRRGYYHDNKEDAVIMWRVVDALPASAPRRAERGRGVILAIETSCDDTCAAVVSAGGEMRSNVVASQGLLHERYGGVVPEIASRRHLELVDAVIADALESGGCAARSNRSWSRSTQRPGLIGALLVGFSAAKALAAARRLPFVAGRPPARPRAREHARREPDRDALPRARRERRAYLPRPRRRRGGGLRDARVDARRRRGRGVRQGRAPARAALPGRPRARRARARGRPRCLQLPPLGARRPASTSASAA